jgi:hypothetical protein
MKSENSCLTLTTAGAILNTQNIESPELKSMKRLLWIACLISGLTLARADVYEFDLLTGALRGTNEVSPNASVALGGEVGMGISFNNATGLLDINVAYGLFGFPALQGDYTASHLHEAPVGVNGPVVVDLAPVHTYIGTKAGFYSGTVLLTPALEVALFNSDLYMNIHSTLYPGGEIRAQLIPVTVPEPGVLALVGVGLSALVLFRRKTS